MTLTISSVFTYDEDAGNYIQAVEGASGDNQTLEPAVRQAINNFVVGCKQDGIWDAIKASCILAGARTLAGALQPLVGTAPTNLGLSGYDRKTGLIGTGASFNRLNSNYVIPSTNQNNVHSAAWVSTQMTVYGQILFGNADGGQTGMYPAASDRAILACNSGNSADTVTTTGIGASTGFWGIRRSSSSLYDYKIATFSGSVSRNSAIPSSNSVCFLGGNAAPFYPSNARLAFYSIGESLDLAKLDSRVTDLITAFGAAIP